MLIYVFGRSYQADHYDLKSGDLKGQIMSLLRSIMPQDQFSRINIEDLKDFNPNQQELILKQLDFYRDNKNEGVFKGKSPLSVYQKILERTKRILFYKSEVNNPLDESFYKEFVASFDPKIPKYFEVNFRTVRGAAIKFTELENYSPQVIPGSKLPLSDVRVNRALGSRHFTNFYRTLEKDNPDTTQNEGIELIRKYLKDVYLPKAAKKLKELGIRDIGHLTPKQAIELTCFIAMDRIAYSQMQTINVSLYEYKVNDEKAMDDVIREGPDVAENGVCRNYTEVVYGVFEALKMMQNEKTSLLNNMYCLINGFEEGVVEGGMVNNHAWNSFITVTPAGDYHVVVEDATWADDKQRLDPSRTSNGTDLDYTEERLLVTLHRFTKAGVVSIDDEIKGLYLYYLQNEEMRFVAARRMMELFSKKKNYNDEELKIISELMDLFKIRIEQWGYWSRINFSDVLNVVNIAKNLRSKGTPYGRNSEEVLKKADMLIKAYKETLASGPVLFVLNYIEGKISEAEKVIASLKSQKDTKKVYECYRLLFIKIYGFKEAKIDDALTLEDFERFLPRLTSIFSKYGPEDLSEIEIEIGAGLKNFKIGERKLFIKNGDSGENITELINSSVENLKKDRIALERFLDQILVTHPLLHFETPSYSTDDLHAVVEQLPQFSAVLNRIPEHNLRGRTLNIGYGGFFRDTGEVSLYKDGYETLAERLRLDKRAPSTVRQKINAVLSRFQGEIGITNLVLSQRLFDSEGTLEKLLRLEAILKKTGNKEKYGNVAFFDIYEGSGPSELSSYGVVRIALNDSEENILRVINQFFEWSDKIKAFYKEVYKLSYDLKIRVSYSKEVIEKLPQYLQELKRLPLYRLYGKQINLTTGETRIDSSEIYWSASDIGKLFTIYDSNGLASYRRELEEKISAVERKYDVKFCKIQDEVLLNDESRKKLFKFVVTVDNVLSKYPKESLKGIIFDIHGLNDRGSSWINFRSLEYLGIEELKDLKDRFNVIQIESTNPAQLDEILRKYFSLKRKTESYLKALYTYHPDLRLNISYNSEVLAVLPKLVEVLKEIPKEALRGKSLNVVYGYYGLGIEQNSLTVGSLSLETLKGIK